MLRLNCALVEGDGLLVYLALRFLLFFVVILACLVKAKKTRRVLVFRIGESVDEL